MRVIARRHRPLVVIDKEVITYSRNKIYKINIIDGTMEFICKLPGSLMMRVLSKYRFWERLFRYEIKSAILLSEDCLLISRIGCIYNIHLNTGKIEFEHHFRPNMNNPYYFTRIENIKNFQDAIVYGEYIGRTNERFNVSIYSRPLEKKEWGEKFTFPPNQIRHVHGIVPDSKNKCVYILTGDYDNESGIWITKDDFKNVDPILIGSQIYRAVFLFPLDDKSFLYATDTAMQQNYIYHCWYNKNKEEYVINKIIDIDGSCLSASSDNEFVYISTTVENDERVTGLKSWVDYHRSPGIKSEFAQLICIEKSSFKTKKIFQLKKDMFPCRLMQYGYFITVPAPTVNGILVYPIGVKKYDGKVLLLEKGKDY
ncbi:hypothetical protein LK537_26985 [Lachnoclostridium pacaense]|uniref:hypothetical protein n=1 Tax=Enterocloster hominis (ex Hitch et al. 2024) TaxID=1917870 RepID=UPI001D1224C6|nr:hypothetical protein [Lachnoclostridium pacaense]MCC2820946.1 hypothetical protein [Lachnoclostridium pacaense]